MWAVALVYTVPLVLVALSGSRAIAIGSVAVVALLGYFSAADSAAREGSALGPALLDASYLVAAYAALAAAVYWLRTLPRRRAK